MTDNKLYRAADKEKLDKLHPDLAAVVYQYAEDGGKFIVVQTQRGRAEQEKARSTGHSRAHFGESAHNYEPALGADLGPVPYPGTPKDYVIMKRGMFAAAAKLGIHLIWGGDWKTIIDKPHFELANWKILAKHLKLAA